MKCNFETLHEYLNSTLDETRQSEVWAHLQKCEICMEAVLTMQQDQQAGKGPKLSVLESPPRNWHRERNLGMPM
jgi:anti-sigma factor RsiW